MSNRVCLNWKFHRIVSILLISSLAGCSGGGGGSTPQTASFPRQVTLPAAPEVVLGSLLLLHSNLDSHVAQLRLRGSDGSGNVVWGPILLTAGSRLQLSSIPTGVTSLSIEYLDNGVVVGIFTAAADFSGGRTVTISDPNWSHIQALVEITVQPNSLKIPVGFRGSLRASGRFSDGKVTDLTDSVSWSSTQPTLVEVDNSGRLRSRAQGAAAISATVGSVRGEASVEATNASLSRIEFVPSALQLPGGGSQAHLQAVGFFSDGTQLEVTQELDWTSTAESIIRILSPGSLQSGNFGSAEIRAGLGSITASMTVASVPAQIEISEAADLLHVGDTRQLTATAVLQDGSRQTLWNGVNWESSNPARLEVNNLGLAIASEPGDFEVIARIGTVSTQVRLQVDDPRRFVYLLDFYGTLGAFEFDARTGQLTQVSGSPYLPNTGTPLSVTGTPDGRKVFVIGPGAIRTYFRNQSTGALTEGPRDQRFDLRSARVDSTGQFLVFYDRRTDLETAVRILEDGTFQVATTSSAVNLITSAASEVVGRFFIQSGHINTPPLNFHCFELGAAPGLTLRSSSILPLNDVNSLVARRFRGHDLLISTISGGHIDPDIALTELDSQGQMSAYGPPAFHQKTVAPEGADLVATRVGPMVVVGGYNGAIDNAEIFHLTPEGKFTEGQRPDAFISLPNVSTRVFGIPGNRYVTVNTGGAVNNTRIYDFLEGTPRLTWTGGNGGQVRASGLYQVTQPRQF